MMPLRIEFNSTFSTPVESLWAFHMKPDALERLSPRWMGLRIVDPGNGVADGSLMRAEVGPWPLRLQWEALHANVEVNSSFTDIALRSPFPYWVHQHVIEPLSPVQSRLRDVIWVIPPPWIPKLVSYALLRLGLSVLFGWRHRQTRRALAGPKTSQEEVAAPR